MKWSKLIRIALSSLAINLLRTLLAVLGIVIGVAAVIVMIALGQGAERQTAERITSLGSNLLFVRPGFAQRQMVRTATVESLDVADARAIAELPLVTAVVPGTQLSVQVKYYAKNTSTNLIGTTPNYFEVRNFKIVEGRAWTETEGHVRQRLCVIGSSVAEQLFGEGQAVGRQIKVRGVTFDVIGLLESKGSSGFSNPDDQILAPLETVQKRLGAGDHLREIAVQVGATEVLPELQPQIEELLRRRHRIPAGGESDFTIRSQEEILRTTSEIAQTFTLLLAGIALVSLVVGGIGIMNIMLVSVAERTREIGILKAIGARRSDIRRQFLIESVAICLVGGLLGIAVGIGGAALTARLTGMPLVIPVLAVAVSFGFASVTGVFFGWYPAHKASALDPIDALRHE